MVMQTKKRNKHGRVGVPRTRPTRSDLKRNMYQHGFTAGQKEVINVEDKLLNEIHRQDAFIKSLLKLRSAGAIHDAVRQHLG